MADGISRRHSALTRLRMRLKKSKESLADHFEFKMFVIFHFKMQKEKRSAVFAVDEVLPVMTNDYENAILKGAENEVYSHESSMDLLSRDIVQLHGYRWTSKRNDVIGCTDCMDFFLWPRNDIDFIECILYSRWKHQKDSAFKPYQTPFIFRQSDYEEQLMRMLLVKESKGLILSNETQNMFLFVDRHNLDTSKSKAVIFKLNSICLYLPQDQLTNWSVGRMDEHF